MKKVVFLMFLTVSIIFTSCKGDNASSKIRKENVKAAFKRDAKINEGAPIIKWDKTEYDFGTIKQGDKVETKFTLTNVGKGDLVVTNAKSTCGCTIPKWPKNAIKPGESADIDVVFNSRGKKNKITKAITLTTNTEKGNEVVRIKGFVEAPKNNTPAVNKSIVNTKKVIPKKY